MLGRVQTNARNAGQVDAVTSNIQTASDLIGRPVGAVSQGITDFTQGIFRAGGLRAENERLRAQEQAWSLYEARIRDMESEIEQLRALMGLPPIPGREAVTAVAIGYYPHEHRMTLGVGSDQGIRPDQPVLTAAGLIGVVHSVEAQRCQVRLISSPQFQVGAAVMGEVPLEGIAKGEGRDVLILQLLDLSQPIELDQPVVTSGYSERIPRGLPIGKAVQVEDDEQFGIRRVRVFPHVRLSNVRSVVVLK